MEGYAGDLMSFAFGPIGRRDCRLHLACKPLLLGFSLVVLVSGVPRC